MTINKFQGKTKEEAIEKAKQEFGENVVIMNVKEVKPKGLFGAFKSSTYEVTAAMKEKETFVNPISAMQVPKKLHENINLTADEEIKIPKPTRVEDEKEKSQEEKNLEERLSDLSSILDEKLEGTFEKQSGQNYKNKPPVQTLQEALNTDIIQEEPAPAPKTKSNEEFKFVRILYGTLIKNEVNEKYVNQLLEEIEKFLHKDDKRKQDYYRKFAGGDWSDATNYDLCLNAGKLGFEKCVEAILAQMEVMGIK